MYPYQKANVSFQKRKDIGEEGKNSDVYLAHDEHLDAEIVIKEIKKEDGFSVKQYIEEAQILYRSSHPNVVQVSYACEDEKFVYIATPYYKNGSLKSLMATRYLTVREIIKYSANVLNGLHNVHSKGLIHFDIKPDNVLISNRGEGLLSDFGQSKPMNEDGLAKQDYLYQKILPPEVIGNPNNIYDNRFDIYQMGLMMYRMCVGDDSFNEQFLALGSWDNFYKSIRKGAFPNRKSYPLHIPKKLQKTINKCLKPNPGERYGTAIEVVNDLAEIDGAVLDWQYSVDGSSKKWQQKDGLRAKIIKVDANGKSQAYSVNDGGQKRNNRKFTLEHIDNNKIIEFLGA